MKIDLLYYRIWSEGLEGLRGDPIFRIRGENRESIRVSLHKIKDPGSLVSVTGGRGPETGPGTVRPGQNNSRELQGLSKSSPR